MCLMRRYWAVLDMVSMLEILLIAMKNWNVRSKRCAFWLEWRSSPCVAYCDPGLEPFSNWSRAQKHRKNETRVSEEGHFFGLSRPTGLLNSVVTKMGFSPCFLRSHRSLWLCSKKRPLQRAAALLILFGVFLAVLPAVRVHRPVA